jgi:hypothetical protein
MTILDSLALALTAQFDVDYVLALERGEQVMRAVALISMAFVIALPGTAQSELLTTDDQIRKALVGNTVSGIEEGEVFAEYFHPDGRILGEDRQGRYTGHWQILGAQMCMRYAETEGGRESVWDCSEVDIEGSRITWLSLDGEKNQANLLIGNPNGF